MPFVPCPGAAFTLGLWLQRDQLPKTPASTLSRHDGLYLKTMETNPAFLKLLLSGVGHCNTESNRDSHQMLHGRPASPAQSVFPAR